MQPYCAYKQNVISKKIDYEMRVENIIIGLFSLVF
jgi:hypothetical protein